MPEVCIKAPKGANYTAFINESFDDLKIVLNNYDLKDSKVCIVTNNKVMELYGDSIKDIFSAIAGKVDIYITELVLDSTMEDRIEEISAFLASNNYNVADYIVGLGSNLCLDFASYAAASYTEELNYISIPTSLSAMSDCAVSNRAGGIIENFCAVDKKYLLPKFVYCNTECIQSLDPRYYFSGFAYIMKTAIVKSASVYEWLVENLYEISDREKTIVADMIEQNINLKKIYLEKDPLGLKGDQMLLDLGTTVGYAIFKERNKEFTLGESLALGTIAAAHISMKKDMLSLDEYLEIRDMFVPFNIPISIENLDVESTTSLSLKDKKKDEMGKCFVLLKKIGKTVIDRNVSQEEIKTALSEIRFSDDDYVVE